MTLSWKALPLDQAGDGEPQWLLKAPTKKDYEKQLAKGDAFKSPVRVTEEVAVAQLLMRTIEEQGVRIPQGFTYEIWRYPQGLGVKMPSGWTLYFPTESQKLPPKAT